MRIDLFFYLASILFKYFKNKIMVPIIILLEFPFHMIILGYSNKNLILPLVPIFPIETLFAIPPIRRLLRLMGETLQKPLEKTSSVLLVELTSGL